MGEFTQERDFTDNVAGYASFRCAIGVGDPFDGYGAVGGALGSLVDCSVCPLTD